MSKMQERREEKARIKAELDGLMSKVPPSYSDWSWDRTHNFLEAQSRLREPKVSQRWRKRSAPFANTGVDTGVRRCCIIRRSMCVHR